MAKRKQTISRTKVKKKVAQAAKRMEKEVKRATRVRRSRAAKSAD